MYIFERVHIICMYVQRTTDYFSTAITANDIFDRRSSRTRAAISSPIHPMNMQYYYDVFDTSLSSYSKSSTWQFVVTVYFFKTTRYLYTRTVLRVFGV